MDAPTAVFMVGLIVGGLLFLWLFWTWRKP